MEERKFVERIVFKEDIEDEQLARMLELCKKMHNWFKEIEIIQINRTTFEYREPAVNVESLLWATSELCEYQEFMESLEKWEWEDKDPSFKKGDLISAFEDFFARRGRAYEKSTASN